MFVDASAIVAILAEEDGWTDLARKLARAEAPKTSAICIWEASMGLARMRKWDIDETEPLVKNLLGSVGADIIAIDDRIGAAALRAWKLYGKGRHPARLNMGDCFAYASARTLDVPLLFKGNDFSKTDITAA